MDQGAHRTNAGRPPQWDARDDVHLRAVSALRPEVETQLGGTRFADSLGSLTLDARAALLDVLRRWRGELESQIDESRERTLDIRIFAASLELFRFTEDEVALHERDPDFITSLAETLVYHLRGHAESEEQRFTTMAQRLRSVQTYLSSGRASVLHPATELTDRAIEVADGAPDLLRAVADAARQAAAAALITQRLAQEVQQAVDAALVGIAEQRSWLDSLPTMPWQPLGRDTQEELLRLRGLDLTVGEVLDLSRSVGEELRIEATRTARRSPRHGPSTRPLHELAAVERSATTPQGLGEAIAWLSDLAAAARTFVTEQRLVTAPTDVDERILVEAMPTVLAPLGQPVVHIAPQPLSGVQESLLLVREPLGALSEALPELSVADLENLVAALAWPGRHLQSVWTNRTTSLIRRGAPIGALGTVAGTWGQDMVQGWSAACEEMMREAQFRSSPASRLIMIQRALASALLATVDVCLGHGRMTPEHAAAFLVRRGGLRLPVARALVRSLLRSPTVGVSALVGKVRIEQLRREARKAWRASFSEARFHSLMLVHGPIPLAYIFERLADPPPTPPNRSAALQGGLPSSDA